MQYLELIELQKRISEAVQTAFSGTCWVRAEVNGLSVNNGHCYMELVQKDPQDRHLIAKAQATVWAHVFAYLRPYFETETGMRLQSGLNVLLEVTPRVHPLYGLSLNVTDIDPTYTVGEIEMERRKTLERLQKEGIIDMNRDLPFPLLPRRVAVISGAQAAGYQDFMNQLGNSAYAFKTCLFEAVMQGDGAVQSMVQALGRIPFDAFDVVVLLRGGGAVTDLHCYDDYLLASHLAQCPLPVITGVGHQRDSHIADRVAHSAVKTPTAAADLLIDCVAAQDQAVDRAARRIENAARRYFLVQEQELQRLQTDLRHAAGRLIEQHVHWLDLTENRIQQGNPLTLLERGYALVLSRGRTVREAKQLQMGESVRIIVHKGSFEATVNNIKE